MSGLIPITCTLTEETCKLKALSDLLLCKEEGEQEEIFNSAESANGVSFILRDSAKAILRVNEDLEDMLLENFTKKAPEMEPSLKDSPGA